MVLRKKTIVIDGKELEVEMFDTRVIPGEDVEEAIDSLLREEEIEKEIGHAIPKIDSIAEEYKSKKKDVWFYYKIGKVLQFVDKKGFAKEKTRIWERVANNLRPEIFFGKENPPKKATRYPEIMYQLAKQKKENVGKLTWSHWFEILQYPNIYNNSHVIQKLVLECIKYKLSREKLRNRVLEINRSFVRAE